MGRRLVAREVAASGLWQGAVAGAPFWSEWLKSTPGVTGMESCGLVAVAGGGWLSALGGWLLPLSRIIYSYFLQKTANIQRHSSHAAPAPWLPWVYVQWWHPHTYHWGRPRLAAAVRTRSGKWSFSKPGFCKQPAASSSSKQQAGCTFSAKK